MTTYVVEKWAGYCYMDCDTPTIAANCDPNSERKETVYLFSLRTATRNVDIGQQQTWNRTSHLKGTKSIILIYLYMRIHKVGLRTSMVRMQKCQNCEN